MIWTTIVLAAALAAPDDKAGLTLSHVRDTHGLMGPTRTDEKLLPGGELFLCFDIDGVAIDESGKVHYSVETEIADAAGKVLFKQEPRNLEVAVALGGDRIPGFVRLDVGLDTPPGKYAVKVNVVDLSTKKTGELSRTLEVQPKDFGLVRVKTTSDQEAQLPVAVPGAGEGLWVHFAAVGFGRGADKQPDVTFEMRILDENGKPTRQPVTARMSKDAPAEGALLPVQFMLSLNRSGKFTVELTAADAVAGKKAKLSFPLNVREPK